MVTLPAEKVPLLLTVVSPAPLLVIAPVTVSGPEPLNVCAEPGFSAKAPALTVPLMVNVGAGTVKVPETVSVPLETVRPVAAAANVIVVAFTAVALDVRDPALILIVVPAIVPEPMNDVAPVAVACFVIAEAVMLPVAEICCAAVLFSVKVPVTFKLPLAPTVRSVTTVILATDMALLSVIAPALTKTAVFVVSVPEPLTTNVPVPDLVNVPTVSVPFTVSAVAVERVRAVLVHVIEAPELTVK